jgi:hypothetical protein
MNPTTLISRLPLLVLAIFIGSSATLARADNTSVAVDSVESIAAPVAHSWSFELNATLLGSYNENTFKNIHGINDGVSSDFGLDLAVRKSLTSNVATGLRISLFSSISTFRDHTPGVTNAYVLPAMWTGRYQLSQFLGQSFFTPWVDA